MKREREIDSMTMASCLMLLSQGGGEFEATTTYSSNRVFECKTCNRQFSSFQALGGHRASHKKPRLMAENGDMESRHGSSSSPPKPKTHECSICGLEFAIGQALGGHMRRHRAENMSGNMMMQSSNTTTTTMSCSSGGGSSFDSSVPKNVVRMKGENMRVLALDLNLTPFENDLEFLKIGKATTLVDYLH